MPAKKFALLVILLTIFSACKDDDVKTKTPASSDTVNGRVDLDGRGVVSYRKVDVDTPKDTVVSAPKDTVVPAKKEPTKILEVTTIEFYENYIVVETKKGEGHVIKVSDLISFDWMQYRR
ncbi:MAG TPA: hypothetical protein VE732_04935 [Nitrososphaera sp.]|jgi:hypothetical protein|nr:hypothetical protein [Nitrososphaera sp.]